MKAMLYGWLNQRVNLCTALSLIALRLSAVVLWRQRRPEGAPGAPVCTVSPRFTPGFGVLVFALAVYLPSFALSLLLVAFTERFVLRRLPGTRQLLG